MLRSTLPFTSTTSMTMLTFPSRFRSVPDAFGSVALPASRTQGTSSPCGTRLAKNTIKSSSGARFNSPRSIAVSASASSDDENEASTSASPSSSKKDDEDLWIEQELRRRKNARAKKNKKDGPTVIAPAVARAKGESSAAPTDATEVAALQFLGAFFFVLLLEGVALAASGFFPENVDAFITDRIYPTYSPQLGVFLLCSSAYGVWKSKQQ